jgi:tRNA-dihydrouridine synthase
MADISVAPMIGWTDRHYRYLFRHIAQLPTLYTEMIMDTAILYNTNNLNEFLGHDRTFEPPLALQLGGSNPETLGRAVEVCEQYGGFNEINLNCGCPSNKAKRCGFGAELMLEPDLVRRITYEMKRKSSDVAVTVKCRIGTNIRDTWGHLLEFVHACRDGGIRKMIIHARICVLCGLSPAQNRNVPPLRYDVVSRLVDAFPDMRFVLNGGVRTFTEIDTLLGRPSSGSEHLSGDHAEYREYGPSEYDPSDRLSVPVTRYSPVSVFSAVLDVQQEQREAEWAADAAGHLGKHGSYRDSTRPDGTVDATGCCGASHPPASPVHGVMVGREAYNNPWAWATTDSHFYGKVDPTYTRREALDRYLAYAEGVLHSGAARSSIPYLCKPLHNYFTGCRANKPYKQKLDHLLKVHVAHSDKGHRGHIVKCEEGAVTFADLVREAATEIPDAFLDSRGPEARWDEQRYL